MNRRLCHFHSDEDVAGVRVDEDGTYEFTCTRIEGHPAPGPYTWPEMPDGPVKPSLAGLAEDLNLRVELPAAIAKFPGQWVEFGVVEATYAAANPKDFAKLVHEYGHTAIARTGGHTASKYLAATLSRLAAHGEVMYHSGPTTGRWSYNSKISWWALAPTPAWETDRTSWASLKETMDYVPGSTE